MNIETLQIFCDIVELNSFLKAAEKNLLSQSAVSQQLTHLESIYKYPLLNRKRKPFKLTTAGELLYNTAKDILERYDKFNNDLNLLRKATSKRINVAAIYSIGMHTLPPFVKKFIAKYPDINVHIEYLTSHQIHDLVLRNSIDIGLIAVPQNHRNLQIYHFTDEPLVLVCSPQHPLASEKEIDIKNLHLQEFVGFEEGIPTRTLIDDILTRYNVSVHKIMEFDNIETIKRAVEIGAGLSILPETAIHQELDNGTLKAVTFSNDNFIRPTGIIIRKGKTLNRTTKYFLDLLSKQIK